MPLANSSFDCDPERFPSLSPTCQPNCGQVFGPPGTRNVTVYIPAQYKDGDEAAVHVDIEGTDAFAYPGIFPGSKLNVMDNLMSNGSLPTFVYVAVGLAGPGGISSLPALGGGTCGDGLASDGLATERPIELRTVSDDYSNFIAFEVLPFVASHPNITAKYPNFKFTEDPAGRAAEGSSSGGAAAFKLAFLTPDLFGIAITYSAALVPNNPGALDPFNLTNADFWLSPPEGQGLIMARPLSQSRFSLTVGQDDEFSENGFLAAPGCIPFAVPFPARPENPNNNFVLASNETFKALTEKGYQTRFTYGLTAGHVEPRLTFESLVGGWIWAWAAWKEKQGVGTTEWKNNQSSDTAWSPRSLEWPLSMPSCSSGCCVSACTNCANDTCFDCADNTEASLLERVTKPQPRQSGSAEVRAGLKSLRGQW
jgi:hypothetical protein